MIFSIRSREVEGLDLITVWYSLAVLSCLLWISFVVLAW